jgi:predicted GNAT family acetyltransferase
VAVLERDGSIVSALHRSPEVAGFMSLAGTWTDPAWRRRGLGARLVAFVAQDILRCDCKAHLVVDDDNLAAIALYRSVGFQDRGGAYTAYLGVKS